MAKPSGVVLIETAGCYLVEGAMRQSGVKICKFYGLYSATGPLQKQSFHSILDQVGNITKLAGNQEY